MQWWWIPMDINGDLDHECVWMHPRTILHDGISHQWDKIQAGKKASYSSANCNIKYGHKRPLAMSMWLLRNSRFYEHTITWNAMECVYISGEYIHLQDIRQCRLHCRGNSVNLLSCKPSLVKTQQFLLTFGKGNKRIQPITAALDTKSVHGNVLPLNNSVHYVGGILTLWTTCATKKWMPGWNVSIISHFIYATSYSISGPNCLFALA